METGRTFRVGMSALLSQLGLMLALLLDTYFESRAGVDRLASWSLAQAYWLSLFLFGSTCLFALDAALASARDASERARVLSSGLRLSLALAAGSLPIAMALEYFAIPASNGVSLVAMTATFLLWLPYFALRQHALSESKLARLNFANVAGLLAHALVLLLAGFSPLALPLAHAADRAVALAILMMDSETKAAVFAKPFMPGYALFIDGLPVGLQFVARSLVFTVVTALLAHHGPATAAAQGVLMTIGNVLMMLPLSFSVAASINIAGRGQDTGAIREELFRALAINAAALVAALLPVLLLRGELGAALGGDREVAGLVAASLPALAAFILIDSLQTIVSGAFRALRKPGIPFVLFAVCFTVMGVPILAAALRAGPEIAPMPLASTWAALAAVSLLLGFLMLRSFSKLAAQAASLPR